MSSSGWELATEDSIPQNSSPDSSGWEIYEEPETYKQSLMNAPGRMIGDFSQVAMKGINAIPGYYQKAKTEIPALLGITKGVRENGLHGLMQGIAGSQEAINALAQAPLSLAKYGSNRLHLLPESVTNALSKITPEDTTNSINELFGNPKYEGEALLRGTVRNALPITGAAKLAQLMPHLTKRGAVRSLNSARQLAEGRNIGKLNIDPALIEDARQFLPNTLPHRNALNAAHTGDYKELFRLQSDVGKNSGDYAKSFFSAAERSHGRAGLAARNRLLDAIHENLQSQGHHDISNFLRQGQRDYSRYMRFKPYRNALAFGLLSLAIPQNPLMKIGKKVLFQNNP